MSGSSEEQGRRRPGLLSSAWDGVSRKMLGVHGRNQADQPETEAQRMARVRGVDATGNPTWTYDGLKPERPPQLGTRDRSQVDRIYLDVPFSDKDKVKSLGASWDRERKQWWTTQARGAAALAPWLPKKQEKAHVAATPPVAAEMPQEHGKTTQVRQYLEVPFGDKDEAKALGAQWDKAAKAWYVPPGMPVALFNAWLPGKGAPHPDPLKEFEAELRRASLRVDRIEMDGKLHRAPVEGDRGREKNGAYVGWLDGRPGGFIQNFKSGEKISWKQERQSAAPVEAVKDSIRVREQSKSMERGSRAAAHLAAAQEAQVVWDGAMPAEGQHPYLARKRVDGQGMRVGMPGQSITVSDGKDGTRPMSIEGWLIAPVMRAGGALSSLQFISPDVDGPKIFMPGATTKGGHMLIGDIGRGGPILIAEGVATAKTLNEVTGLPTVAAFNAGNLQEAAQFWQGLYPDRSIYIAGDNDHKRDREIDSRTGQARPNVGRLKAEEAAAAIGSVALLPPFQLHERGSDWNDLAEIRGPATARSLALAQIAEAEQGRLAERQAAANAVPFERSRGRAAAQISGDDLER